MVLPASHTWIFEQGTTNSNCTQTAEDSPSLPQVKHPRPTWEDFETHFSTDRFYDERDDALSKTVLRKLTDEALQTYVIAPDTIKDGPCDLILDFVRKLYSRPNDPSHYKVESAWGDSTVLSGPDSPVDS
ncbi:Hypp6675 [Branchiostoma lanceolatum]|uniref:Hypp6675 protein n=1 Tax=Branchiostoma lanceolatum TaxID=7740 RepID=A0A8J9YVC1_BRALA|nr:Hypp6675 [Branchiostoma lanceolatum]